MSKAANLLARTRFVVKKNIQYVVAEPMQPAGRAMPMPATGKGCQRPRNSRSRDSA